MDEQALRQLLRWWAHTIATRRDEDFERRVMARAARMSARRSFFVLSALMLAAVAVVALLQR